MSSRSRSRSRSNRNSAGGVSVITINNPSEYGRLEKLIQQGPAVVILVYSPSCPHCHTYMPLWKELQKTPNKRANMATMEASVYEQTPLSEKKQVEGVPSVLYVDKAGSVSEVSDIRNMANMTGILKSGSNQGAIATLNTESLREMAATATATEPKTAGVPSVIPGETGTPNPLPPLPGMTSEQLQLKGGARRRTRRQRRPHQQVGGRYRSTEQRGGNKISHQQVGGNPWAAFLASAGPAAVLAGAYAALPARSSGLPPPQHSAKWRRIRARLTRRHRR